MWPYTPDEQTWLVPSKEWTASVMTAELAKRTAPAHNVSIWHESQIPLPLPMPAPYDDFVCDPQIMLRK